MNLFADIRELVVAELQALMAAGVLPSGLAPMTTASQRARSSAVPCASGLTVTRGPRASTTVRSRSQMRTVWPSVVE